MNNQHRRGMASDRNASLSWLNVHARRIVNAPDAEMIGNLTFVGNTEPSLMFDRGFISEAERDEWDKTFRVLTDQRKGELGIVERVSA